MNAAVTLAMAIFVVVFVAMQLWVDVVIVSVALVVSAVMWLLPSPRNDDED
jgi:hypothetical protein